MPGSPPPPWDRLARGTAGRVSAHACSAARLIAASEPWECSPGDVTLANRGAARAEPAARPLAACAPGERMNRPAVRRRNPRRRVTEEWRCRGHSGHPAHGRCSGSSQARPRAARLSGTTLAARPGRRHGPGGGWRDPARPLRWACRGGRPWPRPAATSSPGRALPGSPGSCGSVHSRARRVRIARADRPVAGYLFERGRASGTRERRACSWAAAVVSGRGSAGAGSPRREPNRYRLCGR